MDGTPHREAVGVGGGAEASASRMTEEMDGAGWTIENASVRKAKNGGFIVSCSKTKKTSGTNGPGQDYKNEDYAFSTFPEAAAFMEGEFSGSDAAAGGGGQPAPALPARGLA